MQPLGEQGDERKAGGEDMHAVLLGVSQERRRIGGPRGAQLEVAEGEGDGGGSRQQGEHPGIHPHRHGWCQQCVPRDLPGGDEDHAGKAGGRQIFHLVEPIGEGFGFAGGEFEPRENGQRRQQIDHVVGQFSRHGEAAGSGGDEAVHQRKHHADRDGIPTPALDVLGAVGALFRCHARRPIRYFSSSYFRAKASSGGSLP